MRDLNNSSLIPLRAGRVTLLPSGVFLNYWDCKVTLNHTIFQIIPLCKACKSLLFGNICFYAYLCKRSLRRIPLPSGLHKSTTVNFNRIVHELCLRGGKVRLLLQNGWWELCPPRSAFCSGVLFVRKKCVCRKVFIFFDD